MLISDVRHAVRSLRRRPAFSVMAVLMLALGIGANTAIFSVVDAVLLRSLPYADVDSLVVVFADGAARGQSGRLPSTVGDFLDWRESTAGFTAMTALRNESRRITSVDTPIVPLVHAVAANYFDVLGVRPAIGRTFNAGEDAPGNGDVVILSYGLWQSVFGGDPTLVGRPIDLDGRPHTVVGVMKPDFYSAHVFSVQPGLWVPAPFSAQRNDRTTRDVLVYGRLARGRSLASAQAEMAAITARLAKQFPDTNDRWSAALVPLRDHVVGPFSQTGGLLLAAVGLVLLLACANVANLTLALATERARDVALRAALGASRSRIVGQLLVESLVLSLAGGAVGAALAAFAAEPLARLIPPQAGVPFLDRVSVDPPVLIFTLIISIASGVVFGLAPSRRITRLDVIEALREGGRGNVSAPARRMREMLVVCEVALAVVIVSAAGLMLRTYVGLLHVRPGFEIDHVLKIRTSLRGEAFETPASRVAHFDELKRRLEGVPGVARASAVSAEPPVQTGVFGAVRLTLPGVAEEAAAPPSAVARIVMPDYFDTMGIPIVSGRGIAEADGAAARRVVVISLSMARRYFPAVDPIGRSFAVFGPRPQPMEIVGVAGDVITAGTDPTPLPAFYMPYAQNPLPVMSVVMRVPKGDANGPAVEAERTIWSLSRDTNVYAVETMGQRMRNLYWRTRFSALLLGGFAALAVLLGAAGIYAVISYTVFQRRGEIGLRMALGARGADIAVMVLTSGLRPVAIGLLVGAAAAAAATRVLAGLLYGVAPGDPATLAGVGALIVLVAVGACLGPVIRAVRVDPQTAMRNL